MHSFKVCISSRKFFFCSMARYGSPWTGQGSSWTGLACSSANHRHPYQVRHATTEDWEDYREDYRARESALTGPSCRQKKTRYVVLTWQDMDVLESMNKALSPLMEFTDALSGEQCTSVSCVKPVLHLFNTQVLKPQDDDTQLTINTKEGILKYWNDKYDDQT